MCPSRGRRRRLPLFHYYSVVLLIAVTSSRVRAGPSKDDMIEYLGGTATGQTLTTVAYSLTVLSNETDVLVSCEIDQKMSQVGWLGFGVGSTMSDADIVILWPNSDSSWTLSHRRATTTALPLLLGDPVDPPQKDSTGLLSIVPSLSSSSGSDSPTIVTFSRPLNPSTDGYTTAENYVLKREINQGVIFAKGDDNPGESKQDSDGLKQHSLDAMGGSYVDLSVEFKADSEAVDAPLVPVKGDSSALPTGGGGGGTGSSSNSTAQPIEANGSKTTSDDAQGTSTGDSTTGRGQETGGSTTPKATETAKSTGTASPSSGSKLSYATVIKIHAICAASAWLFFAPLGVLYARFGRGPPGTTLFKFPWHFFQQSWITTPLTLIAVALAAYATSIKSSASSSATATSSGHQVLGFTFVVLLAVQVLLGWWTHLSHAPARPGVVQPRALKAWVHIVLGVGLIGIGFVQVRLGMDKYGATDKTFVLGYWGAIGAFSLLYFTSLLFTMLKPSPPPPSPSRSSHSHRHRHESTRRKEHRPLRKPRSRSRRRRRRKRRKEAERQRNSSSSATDSESEEDSRSDSESGASGSDRSRRSRHRRARSR